MLDGCFDPCFLFLLVFKSVLAMCYLLFQPVPNSVHVLADIGEWGKRRTGVTGCESDRRHGSWRREAATVSLMLH